MRVHVYGGNFSPDIFLQYCTNGYECVVGIDNMLSMAVLADELAWSD